MTPAEAAALLTICAAYDNRKPDADAAKAWAMALDDHRFEDCRDAVVAHYRNSREWIMPADVLTAVKKVRTGRLEDVAPQPPQGLDPDDTGAYQRWLRSVLNDVADGREVAAEEYIATRQIGELRHVVKALPPGPSKPHEKTTEHDARMAEVRAELAARGAQPMPDEVPAQRESGETSEGDAA